MSSEEVAFMRSRYSEAGLPVDNLPDDDIRKMVLQVQEDFRDKAPTSASQAAKIILDGVREERWRILVGDDAYVLDEIVREAPEEAYEPSLGEKNLHFACLGFHFAHILYVYALLDAHQKYLKGLAS